jgi:hypothetical protein
MIQGHRVRVARLKDRVNRILGALTYSGKEGLIHAGHAGRSLLQALSLRVFANGIKDAGYRLLYLALLDRNSP